MSNNDGPPPTTFLALPPPQREARSPTPAPPLRRAPAPAAAPPPPPPALDPAQPFGHHRASMDTTMLRLPHSRRQAWGLLAVLLLVLAGVGLVAALLIGWVSLT